MSRVLASAPVGPDDLALDSLELAAASAAFRLHEMGGGS